jgi:signal transduction histidine kinase
MRATGAFPKALRRDVQTIYREADRAAKIVRNLLVFAGSRRLVRKRVSVNAALTRVFALRAPASAPKASSWFTTRATACRAEGRSADAPAGVPEHRAERRTGDRHERPHRSSKGAAGQPAALVVEIRDHRPGLPPDVLPRVFEPFYTTKEVGKGTGLGWPSPTASSRSMGADIGGESIPTGAPCSQCSFPSNRPWNRAKILDRGSF